jgi:hypothetical protein
MSGRMSKKEVEDVVEGGFRWKMAEFSEARAVRSSVSMNSRKGCKPKWHWADGVEPDDVDAT